MKTGKISSAFYSLIFLSITVLNISAQPVTGRIAVVDTKSARAADIKLQVSIERNEGVISWLPLKEIKVRRYELEKSSDGNFFNYITAVAGNVSCRLKNYFAKDRNLSAAVNYYRIKIVTAEGNYLYSKTVALDAAERRQTVKILSAQTGQKLFIWMPVNASISQASISDASGRNMPVHPVVNNITNLADTDISGLPVGLYNISLLTNKGETVRLKFSKGS